MPYEWVNPDVAIVYAGVTVYHCYDENSHITQFWYTTDLSDCDVDNPQYDEEAWPESNSDIQNGCAQFDVRDVAAVLFGQRHIPTRHNFGHKTIIKAGIDAGLIRAAA